MTVVPAPGAEPLLLAPWIARRGEHARMRRMDPFAILGLAPGAAGADVTAAYRELAKRWHPDRGGGEEAQRRMAEINVAYELLRAGEAQGGTAAQGSAPPTARRFSDPLRRALGRELLEALHADEEVRLVCPASTWASPRAILAVTDRRLLWLLDDAPVARVRSLAFKDVSEVSHAARRPRRRVATLTVRTLGGRRFAFSGLRPHTASLIERHVRAGAPAAAAARAAD